MTEIDSPLVPEQNATLLHEKEYTDYKRHRRNSVEWLLVFEKDRSSYDEEGYVLECGRLRYARQYYERLYKHHHNLFVPSQTQEPTNEVGNDGGSTTAFDSPKL